MSRRQAFVFIVGVAIVLSAAIAWWLIDPAIGAAHSRRGPEWFNRLVPAPDVHSTSEYVQHARSRLRPLFIVSGSAGVALALGSLFSATRSVHGTRSHRMQVVRVLVVVAALVVSVVVLAQRAEVARSGGVVISEVSSSNPGDIFDADGDHPDWIEIHNTTDDEVDLTGWTLSTSTGNLSEWTFPAAAMGPDERMVIFASGKDRRVPHGELHTNFRLDRQGEELYLVEPDGWVVSDQVRLPEIPRGASFGRDPNDRARWCLFAFPAPGSENAPVCHDDVALGAPRLSHLSGFYDDGFELTIDSEVGGDVIYTLDGSYPDLEHNGEQTLVYDGPIAIAERRDEPAPLAGLAEQQSVVPDGVLEGGWARGVQPPGTPRSVPQATVLRARTAESAESMATFFIGDEVRSESLPVLSLTLDRDFLFDHETGIHVAGRIFDAWANSEEFTPEANWGRHRANYREAGREWQRPGLGDHHRAVVVEYCDAAGSCGTQTNVGVRIHGNFTRLVERKSLRLHADDARQSGFFPGAYFGDTAPAGHRRVLLRNSGNDHSLLLFKDAYLQSLMGGLHVETQAWQPVVVFVNGEYWGLFNLRERYDQHYLSVVHGADPDSVVIVDRAHNATRGDERWADAFQSMWEWAAVTDPRDPGFRADLEAEIDMTSYFDYLIAHIYVGNGDWPGNNSRAWMQPYGADAIGEGSLDGRWRWMIYDLDASGSLSFDVDYDVFGRRMAPTTDRSLDRGEPAGFHNIMANTEIRDDFLRRFSDHINSGFRAEHAVAELDRIEAELLPEIPRHIERWGRPESLEAWRDLVERQRQFMIDRPAIQRSHLEALFDLEAAVEVRFTADPTRGHVRVGSIDVVESAAGVDDASSWTGHYWPDVPIIVEAIPDDGATFVHWEIDGAVVSVEPVIDVTPSAGLELRAVFAS